MSIIVKFPPRYRMWDFYLSLTARGEKIAEESSEGKGGKGGKGEKGREGRGRTPHTHIKTKTHK